MTETQSQQQPLPDDARERLRQHFLQDRTPSRWNELWTTGSFLPWDRGVPNPALKDALLSHSSTIGPPLHPDGTRKRALVPGCGKGYDVLLLSAAGYDAYGLEVSGAVEAARSHARGVEGEEAYAVFDEKVGPGKVEFVEGDFYSDAWEKVITGDGEGGGFDLIYDYTVSFSASPSYLICCAGLFTAQLHSSVSATELTTPKFLCAMPPTIRPSWSKRMSELLAQTGTLICLEFPTYKDPKTGGPPWGLTPETYEMLLPYPGEEPEYDDKGYVVKREGRAENPRGLRRVAHWKAERTHPIGQGNDCVSLWQHGAGS